LGIAEQLTNCGADAFKGRDRAAGGQEFSIEVMIYGKYRLLRLQSGSGEVQRRASFWRGEHQKGRG
jgi:hypothetical protein